MIDLSNLHENWRSFHLAHINQLEMMIADKHPQQSEAKRLLEKAKAEMESIENDLKNENVFWSR